MAPDIASSVSTPMTDAAAPVEEALVYSEKTIHPGVCSLVLNRPNAHNSLSRALLSQMEATLDELAARCCTSTNGSRRGSLAPTVAASTPIKTASPVSPRSVSPPTPNIQNVADPVVATTPSPPKDPLLVLIIRSSSPSKFCAGADLKERKTMSEDEVVTFLGDLRRVFDKVARFPVPTIAALDGPALGGGLELAIACDFRVASRTVSRIGFPETGLGVIPGAGGTQRAPRLLGLTKAKELIFTGRSLTATEAIDWGLVDYLAEPGQTAVQRALDLAKGMSTAAPLALQAAKLSIQRGLDMELDEGLEWETQCYEELLPTQDRREALEAFQEKRRPSFIGA